MDQELLPPTLEWPQWQWRLDKWLDRISFALGIIALFRLDVALFRVDVVSDRLSLTDNTRLLIAVALASVPISIPALVWLWKAGDVAQRRVLLFPGLLQRARQVTDELIDAKRTIYGLVQSDIRDRAFEISGVLYEYEHERLYIEVKKKRRHQLVQGDVLLVVDTGDAMPMGWFEVTEDRTDGYYAVGTDNIDALWLGHMREQREAHMVPNLVAIHRSREESDEQ